MAAEDEVTGADGLSRRTVIRGAGAAVAGSLVSTPAIGSGDASTPDTPATGATNGAPITGATGDTSVTEATDDPSITGEAGDTPVIGANLNGRPHRLDGAYELLDVSETTWVRAFLDVRQKRRNGIRPENDPDVVALRRAARRKDCNLVVSLKWDFKANWGDKDPMNVPRPGSKAERELCRTADQYLGSIGAPVDVVVLGNEPMWETREEDIEVDDPPIVRFTRTVKDHLRQHGDHGDPTYLVGAFNRGHDEHVREQQFPRFHRNMYDLVREDEDIDGVDLHVHYDAFAEAEGMVAAAREAFPDGVITVTEFSPVFRYARNVQTPITAFDAGETFARDYDIPTPTTAVEYFEYAKRDPRPPGEVADFYEAMPWYNVDQIEDVYALFADYDVSVGTFGFLLGPGMRNEDWTTGWTPFHINFLFQPGLMQTERGIEHTAHPHYIDDYRERATRVEE